MGYISRDTRDSRPAKAKQHSQAAQAAATVSGANTAVTYRRWEITCTEVGYKVNKEYEIVENEGDSHAHACKQG